MKWIDTTARAAALPALALVAAAGFGAIAARERHPMHRLDVRTSDFAFEAPDSAPAGLTAIRLENRGHELHHLQLLRLADGHGFGELEDSIAAGGRLPDWAARVGGPNVPGLQPSEVTLFLRQGTYAMICLIPSPTDGKSHFRKGMVHRLEVVGPVTAGPRELGADLRLALDDYTFRVDSVLPAGRHLIQVTNVGRRHHELVMFRLAPGKTPADLLAWAAKLVGPPPGVPSGGITGIAPGGTNVMNVDLVPGQYALLCFVHDPGEPLPHASRGMIAGVRVS
jgi:hypothetical protein